MHRHRQVLPIVLHSQTRGAATAANAKPRTWDVPSPAPTTPLRTSKWSLPSASATPGSARREQLPLASGSGGTHQKGFTTPDPSGSREEWSIFARTTPQGPTSSLHAPRSNKWAPPATMSIPTTNTSTSHPPKPQRIAQSPSSNSLNRWARNPAQTLSQNHRYMEPSATRSQNHSVEQYPTGKQFNSRFPDNTPPQVSLSQTSDLLPRKYPGRSNAGIQTPGTSYDNVREGRQNKDAFKGRGSLMSKIREGIAIPHPKGHATPKKESVKVKRARPKTKKTALVDVFIPTTVSVGMLARLLNVRLEHLQRQMRQAGMMDEATYDYVLTSDYAALLAEEFGCNPIINDEAAFDIHPPPLNSTPSTLPTRPPVVTIMGHVDHGKTTLLDTLRSSSVAKGEAGGITQHIGAFSVPVPGGECGQRSITFLDTPGHAAFSAMRARGASVTDIVVLVVAADDGIMPQTKEVINLIKKDDGKVGVVVAINKVDKPGCDIEAVQKALMAENIQLEALGGDIPSVNVSGLTGEGLSELVETLSLMAEMQDLRAERAGPVQGYVLESKVLKGLGPVATVLILRGCLMPGTHIISGVSHGKVRVMNDPTGAAVKAAYPGMAITVCGWKTLPQAGDEVLQGTEAEIKKALSNRLRKSEIEASLVDVEAINSTRRLERERRELEVESTNESPDKDTDPEGPKELRLIIKADVSGSAEAVVGALQGIGNNEAMTKIVSSSVGDITESDVMMAKATGGIIVAFSVSVPRAIQSLAAQNGISICSSSIIYRLMDDIKERVIGLLPVITETKVTGEATVLQLFDIQLKAKQTKKVAGCRVINGIVEKIRFARVIRDGSIIHEGTLDTMRHLKKDVTEVRKGSECGLSFNGFSDLRDGDLIQMYQKFEKPGIL